MKSYIEQMRKRKSLTSDHGLVGQYFNGSDFSDPEKGMIDVLGTVDCDWGKDRGNDWSEKWSGFIEGPVTGEVTFTSKVRDDIRLTIGDTVVIDGFAKEGAATGKIHMVKGRKLPIKLDFSTGRGKALLRLYWQWSGQSRQLVSGSVLSHDPDKIPPEALLFDYDNRLSDR